MVIVRMMAVVVPVFAMHLVPVPIVFPPVVVIPIWMFPAMRHWPSVSKARIIVAIHVSMKAFRSAVPRSRADKHAAPKPLRPVVSKRSARIRRIVEVAVGAHRWRPDLHMKAHLGGCPRSHSSHAERRSDCHSQDSQNLHPFLLLSLSMDAVWKQCVHLLLRTRRAKPFFTAAMTP